MPIFYQKISLLSKARRSNVIFFKFLMKYPLSSFTYLVKKRYFCENYTLFWGKRINRIPIFSLCQEKFNALIPIFSKNSPFCEKHVNLMPLFCRKNVHSLKTRYSRFIQFKFFMRKPPFFMHKIGQKNVNSVKITLYYGPKKLIGCPYFLSFFK